MKGSIVTLATASLLATGTSALHYEKRDNPKVFSMPIRRETPSPAMRERMRMRRALRMAKRDNTISQQIDNLDDGALYVANVTLGTPSQNLRFHIDTGSSDLWANTPNSTLCQMTPQELQAAGIDMACDVTGTFDSSKSSSWKYVNSDFYISYADTTGASGVYGTDTLTIGGATIENQQFGLGFQSNSSEGVMGIGYLTNEASIETDRKEYANVPQQMVQQGLINTPSYSLWLNDLATKDGTILFGGVDTSKFTGSLTTVPVVPIQGQYSAFYIGLSSITMNQGSKATEVDTQAIPVLLDSGSTLMYLPTGVTNAIYAAVGVVSYQGNPVVKCSLAKDTTKSLDFNFSGQKISVSMAEIVLNQVSNQYCLFGIQGTDDDTSFTLGDSFIRNAYLVYDLNANTVSLAQTNFSPGNSDVQEITNGTSGVPSATAATTTAAVSLGEGSGYNGGAPTDLSDLKNAAGRLAPAWTALAVTVAFVVAAM